MAILDVGIVGGGLIAQVEHLPNLMALPGLFRVRGLADPSAKVRAHLAARHGIPVFQTAEALLDAGLDAVLIAAPDTYHAELTVAALERGLHVFCEKPVCYAPQDADAVAAARDRAGRIVQLGYMKRFDPAFLALREMVAGAGATLRMVSVAVNDPDFWPYVAHRDYLAGDDVPPALVAESGRRRAEQVARALGRPAEGLALKGFTNPYASAMVHDVNLVHGLLDAMGLATGAVTGAAVFAGGDGAEGSVRLAPGDALWSVHHLTVPGLADYRERVTLAFDDRILELVFPSPYLNHQPTELIEKRSEGHHARTILHRLSYREAFVEELRHWHAAIAGAAAPANTVEEARRDMALLVAFARKAIG